jgi:hypothetical protein
MTDIITEVHVHAIIDAISAKYLRYNKAGDSWYQRERDIFFSDGYEKPEYRTVFFCVKGSPNKFQGMIVGRNPSWKIYTCCGIFRTDLDRLWKNGFDAPPNAMKLDLKPSLVKSA